MRRNVSLEEISDGRLYQYTDMVKADCHGCKNCHTCCTGMGESIILDVYDVYLLTLGLDRDFSQLLEEGALELHVVDGCILPNLSMGEADRCVFLDAAGRCSVHNFRPGICRLFPLGRYYENGDFKYFLQTGECMEQNRTKIKVSKWISVPDYPEYHRFVLRWHKLLGDIEDKILRSENDDVAKQMNMVLLQKFFVTLPYHELQDNRAFYTWVNDRIEQYRLEFDINE